MLVLKASLSWGAEDLANLCFIPRIHYGGSVGFSNSIHFPSTPPASPFSVLEVSVCIYIYQKNLILLGLLMALMFAGNFFTSTEVLFSYSDL